MQPENQLVNVLFPLRKLGSASLEEILAIHPTEQEKTIFGNFDNAIPSMIANAQQKSLMFIYVRELYLYVNERKRSRANFYYNNVFYRNMSVTDQNAYGVDGVCFPSAYLIVSLANQAFEGLYYKFVAKIFVGSS